MLDFIDKLPPKLIKQKENQEYQKYFFEFLVEMINIPIVDKYNELLLRKFLLVLDNLINGGGIH